MVKRTIRKVIAYLLLLVSGSAACLIFLIGTSVAGADGISVSLPFGLGENSASENDTGDVNQTDNSQNEDIVVYDEDASANDAAQTEDLQAGSISADAGSDADAASQEDVTDTAAAASAAETAQTEYDSTEGGIHTYQLVQDDGSWNEAF
ncbi:MAG: hypothetical protein LUF35_05950 [Lachnospiraceae bacterium]|nr:hypothetical protein [Lachnospiraceae bacterium]